MQIGRYEIRNHLGRGGMAVVYRGFDPVFQREVAIKVLPAEWAGDLEMRARFEREARVIAALEHSAIVPVYDFGNTADGAPYLVMRLMTGGTLADRLRQRGPLPNRETLDILDRLAAGLDFAHQRNVLHRDLKPANILFDPAGQPTISDFGLAKFIDIQTALTQTGLMGTPAYMSPEQARGAREIDGASDRYALGVIAFELLSGAPPFDAPTPVALALKHITDTPPRLNSLRPELPVQTDEVFNLILAKAPGQRFSTSQAFAAALRSSLQAQPARTRPGPALQPTLRPMPATGQVLPAGTPLSASPAPARRRGLGVIIALTAGVAGLVACLAVTAIGALVWNQEPASPGIAALTGPAPTRRNPLPSESAASQTPTPSPTRTPRPTATLAPTIGPTPSWTDDFSAQDRGWALEQTDDHRIGYAGQALRIEISATQRVIAAINTDQRVTGARLEVTGQALLNGTYNGIPAFGLICGFRDYDNYVFAALAPSVAPNERAEFILAQIENDFDVGLDGPDYDWQPAPDGLAHSEDQLHRLTLECAGGWVRFWADGVLLTEVEFEVAADSRVGVVGINGQGPSDAVLVLDDFALTRLD